MGEILKKYMLLTEKYQIPLKIAVIQWFITTVLQVDRAFFIYEYETKCFWIVKFFYFMFLVIAWSFGFNVYKQLKSENLEYKRGVQIFVIYFSIVMGMLLIVWPGTWSWDDLWTLDVIKHYSEFNAWQHIITGLYQDVMLQILPFPGGIIFLQNVIISICVAFSITKLEKIFPLFRIKNTILDVVLKSIPFLLPPVLLYKFSGYRIGLYVYLEVAVLILLVCLYKENKKWTWKGILLFSFLVIIVSCWRTESFIYIPFFGILILFAHESVITFRKKIICILFFSVGFIGMTKWQSYETGNNNYQIVSTLRPCVELIRHADYVKDEKELTTINKVLDLNIIYENPSLNGENLYWGTGCVRTRNTDPLDDYSDMDYKNYLRAFIKLAIRYPKIVIKERVELFMSSIGMKGECVRNTNKAVELFDVNSENEIAKRTQKMKWIANTPVCKKFRKSVISLLDGKNILKKIIWNAAIPIIALIVLWGKTLIHKNKYLCMLITSVIIRIPLVVLTQPSNWFMYFLSFYLLGYIVVVYEIWIYFSKIVHYNKKSRCGYIIVEEKK